MRDEPNDTPHDELALAGSAPTLTEWPSHYSEQDKAGIAYILAWLRDNDREQAWLARKARLNAGTLNGILRGKYASPPAEHLAKARAACVIDGERQERHGVPYIESAMVREVHAACHRARVYRTFALITGNVGVGKTRALEEYTVRAPNTVMIEADPGMTATQFLEHMARDLEVAVKSRRGKEPTLQELYTGVMEALKGSDTLIILDEAETAQSKVLHMLRRFRDKAKVGVVLSGTRFLAHMIRHRNGHFDQIGSRVVFNPPHFSRMEREDAAAILRAAFADQGQLDDKVVEMFWVFCGGSARVLVENLIPAVRDYGLNKGLPLTSALVGKIAKTTLNLTARIVKEPSRTRFEPQGELATQEAT